MNLEDFGIDFLESISETIDKENITDNSGKLTKEEIDLAQKLEAIDEFTIDRFEEDIAILENRKTGKMIEVARDKLPNDVKEGDILNKINGKFIVNDNATTKITESIEEKMNRLWN